MPISAKMRYQKKTAQVLGKRMAYVDVGEGDLPLLRAVGRPKKSPKEP
jgi:hypothetical protein